MERPDHPAGGSGRLVPLTRRTALHASYVAAIASLTLLGLSACGGSKQSSTAPARSVASAPVTSSAGRSTSHRGGAKQATSPREGRRIAHDTVHSGTVVQRPYAGTGGRSRNDDNPAPGKKQSSRGGSVDAGISDAGLPNPCRLVSRVQAQAMLGERIAIPREAPLGPTCIYPASSPKHSVTLAVQTIDFALIKHRMHAYVELRVGKRAGYCANYGLPAVYVPLSGRRVLSVTGKCATAVKFATAALRSLGV